MTDTMMIVLGVLLVIFVGYVAISIMLIATMLATDVYCAFFSKIKNSIAEYRENKDE